MGPLKDESGNIVSDNTGMANILNRTFKAVFTRESVDEVPVPENGPRQSELKSVKFTVKSIKQKIDGLRIDAAAGPDRIEPRVLKELASGLAPALEMIFRKSMAEGEVPVRYHSGGSMELNARILLLAYMVYL